MCFTDGELGLSMIDDKLCDLVPGETYHVYNRAHGDELMFRDPWNYVYFMDEFKKRLDPLVKTIAYCLLPNHFHLLIQVRSSVEIEIDADRIIPDMSAYLSLQFSNFFVSYTKSYNRLYYRKGGLFMHRFKRKRIDSAIQFQLVFVYVHRNPIHHGLVSKLSAYHHSSYHDYKRGKSDWLDLSYATLKLGPSLLEKLIFASELPLAEEMEED